MKILNKFFIWDHNNKDLIFLLEKNDLVEVWFFNHQFVYSQGELNGFYPFPRETFEMCEIL